MKIGEIYWLKTESDISHPHIVISVNQADNTALVCALTTNQTKLNMPGVVILNKGEANLEKESIVEVYKTLTVKRTDLKDLIGSVSNQRIEEIINGMGFVKRSFF